MSCYTDYYEFFCRCLLPTRLDNGGIPVTVAVRSVCSFANTSDDEWYGLDFVIY